MVGKLLDLFSVHWLVEDSNTLNISLSRCILLRTRYAKTILEARIITARFILLIMSLRIGAWMAAVSGHDSRESRYPPLFPIAAENHDAD